MRVVAGEANLVNFHAQDGKDYYSEEPYHDNEGLVRVIGNSIGKFNWQDFDYPVVTCGDKITRLEQTKKALAIKIFNDVELWRVSNIP